ncbi:urease accessory protein UreE [Kaistia granuli]|uniref:urease accessory protein UreE n=1 Tax=Kaistia granuli TaxID=363259 RepID=UPI00035C1AB6|nr:urease accessory protein UreE [Kaistia granuli]
MIRATSVLPAGTWAGTPADTVLLDFEARRRRRVAMSAKGGMSFFLDLPASTVLRQGDGLLLEDGRVVLVEAAVEPLADIAAPDAATLARLAWHLGNQRLPTQLLGDHLRIRRDPIVEAELVERGARIAPVVAAFDPEADAVGPGGPGFWHSVEFSHGQGFSRHSSFSHHSGDGFAGAYGHSYASSSHAPSYADTTSEPPHDPGGGPSHPDWDEADAQDGQDHRPG